MTQSVSRLIAAVAKLTRTCRRRCAGRFRHRAPPILIQHRRRRRRATARRTDVADFDQAIEVADAAGGFKLHARRATGTHQFQIVLGRALVVVAAIGLLHEAVARQGFHPIRAGVLRRRPL